MRFERARIINIINIKNMFYKTVIKHPTSI